MRNRLKNLIYFAWRRLRRSTKTAFKHLKDFHRETGTNVIYFSDGRFRLMGENGKKGDFSYSQDEISNKKNRKQSGKMTDSSLEMFLRRS